MSEKNFVKSLSRHNRLMTLSETELVEKNLKLARRWLHGVLEHPDVLDQLPDEAYLVDLPHDDPDLLEANLQMAAELAWLMDHNGLEKHPIVLLP